MLLPLTLLWRKRNQRKRNRKTRKKNNRFLWWRKRNRKTRKKNNLYWRKKYDELKKVKEFIEDHYFSKHIEHNGESIFYNNELKLTITDDFSKYQDKKYDLIVSFINSKEQNIEIINTFKKTYYLFHRICSKDELIKGVDNIISSENLLLTNHFRIRINKFLNWDKNDSLSESTLSALSRESFESRETNDIKFKD